MLTLTEILRAQNVNRWNLIATTREQSVAEHTFNVTMIVRALAKALKIDDNLLTKAAIEHDLDEVMTGDIPSPTKALARQMGMDLGKIEGAKKNCDRLMPLDKTVLKFADLLESVHFLDNFGTGHRATVVKEELMDSCSVMIKTVDAQFGLTSAYAFSAVMDDVLYGEQD
jgi:5'-deoxynucleotidase YfbR-like HD superfamily hydrolase